MTYKQSSLWLPYKQKSSPGTELPCLPCAINESAPYSLQRFTCDQVKWQWWQSWSNALERISVWPPLPWAWCCSLWWIALPWSLEKPMFYNSSSFPAWHVTHHLWGLKGFGQQQEDTISGSHVARHDLQSEVWGSHVKGSCEDLQGPEPVSYLWCGETVLQDPTSHLLQSSLCSCWSFTAFLSRLGRFRQLSSNHRDALWSFF